MTPETPKLGQEARQEIASAEKVATTAALSAVNNEKSWFAKNWKQLAGIGLGLLLIAYLIHKL